MVRGSRRIEAAMAAAVLAALGGRASAAIVYLGLPSGGSSAYVTLGAGTGWTRVPTADLPDVGTGASPALADLDRDGDADALVGDSTGHVLGFENQGTDAVPVWTRRPSWDVGVNFGGSAAPALADLDGDGDADLVVGTAAGEVAVFVDQAYIAMPAPWARATEFHPIRIEP